MPHGLPQPPSRGAPIKAVPPSDDKATLVPNWPPPATVNLETCVQPDPEFVNTQAAPLLDESSGPPISALVPSEERAALVPNAPLPDSSLGVIFDPCWVQVEP